MPETREIRIAKGTPTSVTWVAMTNALIVATTPADRSIPPVSIVKVWQAASIARGMANLIVLPAQRSLTMPGRMISSSATSASSNRMSGITGLFCK